MDRIAQIQKDSASLNELDRRIHETFKHRDVSPEHRQQWSLACKTFLESYDALFFPGGGSNFARAKAGDPAAVEAAIDFLIADPRHFRSGYAKEALWRRAPKWPLSSKGIGKLENAALAYLDKQIRRDFWYMCRAMARIGSSTFWQDVRRRLTSPNEQIAKRASYLLAYSSGIEAGERVRMDVYYAVLRSRYG